MHRARQSATGAQGSEAAAWRVQERGASPSRYQRCSPPIGLTPLIGISRTRSAPVAMRGIMRAYEVLEDFARAARCPLAELETRLAEVDTTQGRARTACFASCGDEESRFLRDALQPAAANPRAR